MRNHIKRIALPIIALFIGLALPVFAADPLPSWNDTASKKEIITFVKQITTKSSPNYVPVPERIATFDNDGTLWAEQPMYFQMFFALDRVKVLAPEHPEWKDKEPFASLLKGDVKEALAGGEPAVAQIIMATHAGMTTDGFRTNRQRLDRHRKASHDQTALHRDGL